MSASEKFGLDFAAGVYLSEAKNPYQAPPPPVYVYTVYLFTQGRGEGGGVEPERRIDGQQFTKLGRKYQLTDTNSIL